MTIDEAIKHCEDNAEMYEDRSFHVDDRPDEVKELDYALGEAWEKAGIPREEIDIFNPQRAADENRQLAEWLRELKELREKVSGSDAMRICELEKVNEHLREWNRKLTDLKNEFVCKYGESQEELQELREKHWDECRQIAHYDNDLKEVIKLTGTTIETALENLDAKDLIRELATYLYDAIDGFRALGKELDDNCELNLECDKCPLRNGGNCRSWKHTKAVLKLIGGI